MTEALNNGTKRVVVQRFDYLRRFLRRFIYQRVHPRWEAIPCLETMMMNSYSHKLNPAWLIGNFGETKLTRNQLCKATNHPLFLWQVLRQDERDFSAFLTAEPRPITSNWALIRQEILQTLVFHCKPGTLLTTHPPRICPLCDLLHLKSLH